MFNFNTLLAVTVFATVAMVTCLPHPRERGQKKAAVCLNYMEDCDPFFDQCCDGLGLSCVNLRKGYCAFPYERCVCQKKSSSNLDQWEFY